MTKERYVIISEHVRTPRSAHENSMGNKVTPVPYGYKRVMVIDREQGNVTRHINVKR